MMKHTPMTGRNTIARALFTGLLSLVLAFSAHAQNGNPEITAGELREHVRYLASDELEGRGSGTQGNQKAAVYLARQLHRYGITPGGDNKTYYQNFEFVSAVRPGPSNALAFDGPSPTTLTIDSDFRPLGFTTNTSVAAPLVFAGYGISAPESNYDDYAGLDVKGKIVLVFRFTPEGSDPHSPLYRHSSFRNKARVARDNGALAMLIVSAPPDDDELVPLAFDQAVAGSGIAAVSVRRSAVAPLFRAAGRDIQAVQDSIRTSKKPVTFALDGITVRLVTDVEKVLSSTANVIGYLEGSDPSVRDEVVVLGAHFDHLGYGGPGSGSLVPDVHAIHNGADDNASGTAGLLELAQACAGNRADVRRTMVFVFFSGEEMGTLGSIHYVNNPLFPLGKTVAMVNMDMIGRLQNNTLTVYGTGTSPRWESTLSRYNPDSTFRFKFVADGFGPSDHAPFYGKDIPVLFFYTGTHNDYHKPGDDWDKLNYGGQEGVVRLVYRVALDIARHEERPAFAKAGSSTMGGGDSRGFSVTLGIVPDYSETDEGMKVGGIRPNGPAEKAGMKSGDMIIKMAGKKVMNIYDYMAILGELKDGDEVEVEVMRDGLRVAMTARMEKRR